MCRHPERACLPVHGRPGQCLCVTHCPAPPPLVCVCVCTGADVTHPMGGEDLPSIAAVVGSVDATAAKYAARVSMQTGKCVAVPLLALCTGSGNITAQDPGELGLGPGRKPLALARLPTCLLPLPPLSFRPKVVGVGFGPL